MKMIISAMVLFAFVINISYAGDNKTGSHDKKTDSQSSEHRYSGDHSTAQTGFCCIPSAKIGNQTRVGKFVEFSVTDRPPSEDIPGLCSWFGEMWSFDATTSEGKNMLSTLLAAKVSGKPINIDYYYSPVPGTDENSGCTEKTLARAFAITIADF